MKLGENFSKKRIIAALMCLVLILGNLCGCKSSKKDDSSSYVSVISSEAETSSIESTVISSIESSTEAKSSSQPTASKKPVSNSNNNQPVITPAATGNFSYNSNSDIENNLFLDALTYTGYNLAKQRADGMMWKYVLWTDKEWRGWLSGIHYGGGSSGYETQDGKPNLAAFKRGGLVCASYVTYVYFNYLPNVAGIDTSSLTRPNKSYSANDWYIALKSWESNGYSTRVPFNYSGTAGNFGKFTPNATVPIGSIVVFTDYRNKSDYSSHVAIYQGYKNGYHWLTQVGNSNGPEFCAMERMLFGADPQWPIAIFTPPTNIRFSANLEINLKDESGAVIPNAEFTLKNSNGNTISLGKTDNNGKIVKEGLAYGTYTLIETVPSGYTSTESSKTIELTTQNNSSNVISVSNQKVVVPSSTVTSTSSAVAPSSSAPAASTPPSSVPPSSVPSSSVPSSTPSSNS